MNEWMANVVSALSSDEAPWIFSAVILFFAMYFWYGLRVRLARIDREIVRALNAIERTRGPAAFKQRYATIYQSLSEMALIGTPWRLFARHIEPAPGAPQILASPRSARAYFNDDILSESGINMRFYSAVPNLLVGAGLLFSFAGIVAALYFASAGVVATDIATTQVVLGDLLSVATFKFVTSIAGLFASLAFAIAEKHSMHKTMMLLRRFCSALDERLQPINPESLIKAQMGELSNINRQLNRLSKAVYVRVPEHLEDALTSELRQSLQPLQKAIKQASERLVAWDIERSLAEPSATGGNKADGQS